MLLRTVSPFADQNKLPSSPSPKINTNHYKLADLFSFTGTKGVIFAGNAQQLGKKEETKHLPIVGYASVKDSSGQSTKMEVRLETLIADDDIIQVYKILIPGTTNCLAGEITISPRPEEGIIRINRMDGYASCNNTQIESSFIKSKGYSGIGKALHQIVQELLFLNHSYHSIETNAAGDAASFHQKAGFYPTEDVTIYTKISPIKLLKKLTALLVKFAITSSKPLSKQDFNQLISPIFIKNELSPIEVWQRLTKVNTGNGTWNHDVEMRLHPKNYTKTIQNIIDNPEMAILEETRLHLESSSGIKAPSQEGFPEHPNTVEWETAELRK